MIHVLDALSDYFGFGNGIDPSVAMIVWGMYIGCMIGCCVYVYQKRIVGRFVRMLLRSGANTVDNAKTLEELHYGKKRGIRRHLRGKTPLSELVYEVGDAEARNITEDSIPLPVIRDKVDYTTARFFIPAQRKIRAEIRYEGKGNGTGGFIFAAVALFVLAAVLVEVIPPFLDILDGLINL